MVTKKKKTKVIKATPKEKSKPAVSRKDFETFQFGVERLKELKKELDSLDTRGFSKEEQTLRSKLKNVSEIPNIEKELKILKLKVRRKYRPRRKAKSKSKVIQEDIKDLTGEIKKLGREVKEGKKKKAPISPEVGILVDTNFNDFLDHTKEALSNKLKNKEQELKK